MWSSRDAWRGVVLCLAAVAASLLLYQAYLSPAQWSERSADVHAYRLAAAAVTSGEDPYRVTEANRNLRYLYPPTFVLLLHPLLTISDPAGLRLWSWFQLPFLVFILFGVRAAIPRAHRGGARWIALILAILVGPAWRNLVEGQVNGLWVALVLTGVLLDQRGRSRAAGILLALGAHIKVLPVALGAVLLAQRRIGVAVSMGLAGLGIIPGAVLWGWMFGSGDLTLGHATELWGSWLSNRVQPVALNPTSWVVLEYTPWNHSLLAALHRWFDPEVAQRVGGGAAILGAPRYGLRIVAWSVAGAGFVCSLLLGARARLDVPVRMASFGLALIMVNLGHAQLWTHHLLSLALLIPVLTVEDGDFPEVRYLIFSAVGLFAMLFSVTAVPAPLVPDLLAPVLYGLQRTAGVLALPTFSILLLWFTAFYLAWCRQRRGRVPVADIPEART